MGKKPNHLSRTLEQRFWEKVSKKGDRILKTRCWVWVGSRHNREGYGHIGVNRKIRKAHRVSYELHVGPLPEDMRVCHRCDNPPCIRPSHLFLGSDKDNTRDCIKKGRFRGFVKGWNKKVKQLPDKTVPEGEK